MHRPRIIAVFFMLVALGIPAGSFRAAAQGSAQSDALAAANELMTVMSKDTVQQMVANLTNQLWPSVERALRTKRADIDQKTLSDLRSEFERIQLQYMANVMADAPAVYARHFTAQELRDILAFYRTPVGQKSMRAMPQVMSEMFALVMPKMQALQAQIMDAFTRALRQRGIDL